MNKITTEQRLAERVQAMRPYSSTEISMLMTLLHRDFRTFMGYNITVDRDILKRVFSRRLCEASNDSKVQALRKFFLNSPYSMSTIRSYRKIASQYKNNKAA